MTTQEFSYEFDVLYDNIRSGSARGLDEYEKSIFLTQAQELLIKSFKEEFEQNETRRRVLYAILSNYSTSDTTQKTGLDERSVFFPVPRDLMYITHESAVVSSDEDCYDGKIIKVVPVTHDEYNIQKKNPFNSPKMSGRYNVAWRVDYGSEELESYIELIQPKEANISEYRMRYLRRPDPIILQDLQGNESIDGLTTRTECELDPIIHRDILNQAVQMAISVIGNKTNPGAEE